MMHRLHGAASRPEFYGPVASVLAENIMSLPATAMLFSPADRDGNSAGGFAIFRLHTANFCALHVTLTPDGLRNLASQSTALAEALEAAAAREAAAALQKAAGK